jgi:hypothetical protein
MYHTAVSVYRHSIRLQNKPGRNIHIIDIITQGYLIPAHPDIVARNSRICRAIGAGPKRYLYLLVLHTGSKEERRLCLGSHQPTSVRQSFAISSRPSDLSLCVVNNPVSFADVNA